MLNSLKYPFDYAVIQRKKRSIKKELELRNYSVEKRVAILGGSTTIEVQNVLELFLLNNGIKAKFYQSEYNRYFEEIISPSPVLKEFKPDFIYFHTSSVNISLWPELTDSEEDVQKKASDEVAKLEYAWEHATKYYGCQIIQNNFENLNYRELGNLDTVSFHGKNYFIRLLNDKLLVAAKRRKNVLVNDINYLASQIGLNEWHDLDSYFSYKYAMSYKGIVNLCFNVSSIINAQIGRVKKCLVLDLDNTLWGGVIGDDGVGGISLGTESAQGESFLNFQRYVKKLKERGIILAVCSKNDLENAKKGFEHPDTILKLEDFSNFTANWERKDQNIKQIASSLNIGLDSLVFVDDNPAERELISMQLVELSVSNFGESINQAATILDHSLFFDTVNLSKEDFERSSMYKENRDRLELESHFENYHDYLISLDMEAEVLSFTDLYIDRIAQLTNKTNQFNLTTRRCTVAEVSEMSNPSTHIAFCMRLKDKFGDNGIVTVFSGKLIGTELHIDLWLMSCRVFKRTLENSVFDFMLTKCKERGVKKIYGYYIPTGKNSIVESLYADLGFEAIKDNAVEGNTYCLVVPETLPQKNTLIKVKDLTDE